MANYSDWYEKNKNNTAIAASDGIFENLIWLPRRPARLLGWVRFFLFMSLMWFDPFGLMMLDTFFLIPYVIICLGEMVIALMQMGGVYWGHDEDWVNPIVISETPSRDSMDEHTVNEYPALKRWFTTRDIMLGNMSAKEGAKFFVETGALTEDSISEMSRYRHTRRALQRLDFELSNRTPREQIEFLRGYKN